MCSWTAVRAFVPAVSRPCLTDHAAHGDDGVGQDDEGTDDGNPALVAASEAVSRTVRRRRSSQDSTAPRHLNELHAREGARQVSSSSPSALSSADGGVVVRGRLRPRAGAGQIRGELIGDDEQIWRRTICAASPVARSVGNPAACPASARAARPVGTASRSSAEGRGSARPTAGSASTSRSRPKNRSRSSGSNRAVNTAGCLRGVGRARSPGSPTAPGLLPVGQLPEPVPTALQVRAPGGRERRHVGIRRRRDLGRGHPATDGLGLLEQLRRQYRLRRRQAADGHPALLRHGRGQLPDGILWPTAWRPSPTTSKQCLLADICTDGGQPGCGYYYPTPSAFFDVGPAETLGTKTVTYASRQPGSRRPDRTAADGHLPGTAQRPPVPSAPEAGPLFGAVARSRARGTDRVIRVRRGRSGACRRRPVRRRPGVRSGEWRRCRPARCHPPGPGG